MAAASPQMVDVRRKLIRPQVTRAVASERPRPALTFQSTGPTLRFDSPDSVLRTLRERGLRISTARLMIVNCLFEAGGPVSAQQIAGGLDHTPLDLASVYRNLETLEEHGIVRHFHAGHGPGRYVLVGSSEREFLACERCGTIAEVDRSELDALRADVRSRFGYQVGFTHFPMVGLCPRCAARDGRGVS
jgi:Fe2+ or Zn2+ uptake regulation protein